MKKLAYMLIIIFIILIVFGFYGSIKSRNMYKVKKKNVIESYGTIKLKKYNNQNQIYFYPNFNVNKDYKETYFTITIYDGNNEIHKEVFMVLYDSEISNKYYLACESLSDFVVKHINNYKINKSTKEEIEKLNKRTDSKN